MIATALSAVFAILLGATCVWACACGGWFLLLALPTGFLSFTFGILALLYGEGAL